MNSSAAPDVSIIIPTYNRRDSLLRTLESLACQTYPAKETEVIVVDDGSRDATRDVVQCTFPYNFRYLRQINAGATVARNFGASQSRARTLVFMDDDITLHSQTLGLLLEHQCGNKVITLGTLVTPDKLVQESVFARAASMDATAEAINQEQEVLPFHRCMSGLVSLRREDFLALGMFQDPTGGWPNWDDVDFGYRAYQAGYRLIRVRSAVAEHWDYALADLESACQRWWKASYSGARLLERYPELRSQIHMFLDKGPIHWRQDSSAVILRKLARQTASLRGVLFAMESTVPILERYMPTSILLRLLYRWIISGYIYHGYREGLKQVACKKGQYV